MSRTASPRTVRADENDDSDAEATGLGRQSYSHQDSLGGGASPGDDNVVFENDLVGEKEEDDDSEVVDCAGAAANDIAGDCFMTSNPPLRFCKVDGKSGSLHNSCMGRRRPRTRYKCLSATSLRNSLLPMAGFLELANAGDFAANVFNEIPVPTFAAALMAVGGVVALAMSVVAVADARLSWRNVVVLREERRCLQELAGRNENDDPEASSIQTLHTYLDVNLFELRTELVDRLAMDVTMGFGAVLVRDNDESGSVGSSV